MKTIAILFLSMFLSYNNYSQTSSELLREGDSQYQENNFAAAEESYRKARQEESTLASNFNLGNATFKQERYEEAVEHYLNATRKTQDNTSSSDTYYNLGNAYFQGQQLEEAIEAYKQAIRLDPTNKEAKYNLAYSKEMMKMAQQQQQDQQQQQNQDQEQDQENQEQQDSEEQQDQEQQDQENQDQQESDQEQEDQEQQEESEQDSTQNQNMSEGQFDSTRLEKQTLDSLDAAKLLQIIQSEERKVQEKLRKYNSNRKKPDKDW